MCHFKSGFILLYLSIHSAVVLAIAKISIINNNNNNNNKIISIWPLPYDIKLTSKKDFISDVDNIIITIGNDFFFNDLINHGVGSSNSKVSSSSSSSNDNLITRAIQRYENLINTKDLKNYGTLKSCDIIISDSDYYVDGLSTSVIIGADESYKLVLTETAECSITGNYNNDE